MQKIYEHNKYVGVYFTDLVGVILYDVSVCKKWKKSQNIKHSHLVLANFKIKVKQIVQSIVHFDQRIQMISKL